MRSKVFAFAAAALLCTAVVSAAGCQAQEDTGSQQEGSAPTEQREGTPADGAGQEPFAGAQTEWEEGSPAAKDGKVALPAEPAFPDGPVSWRDRPEDPPAPQSLHDVADMPEPYPFDSERFFATEPRGEDAEGKAEAARVMAEERAKMDEADRAYDAGEITLEEAKARHREASDRYYPAKDVYEHGGWEDWNPTMSRTENFRCYSMMGLAPEEREAVRADAGACVRALAEYVWRKYGEALDGSRWGIRELRPVLADAGTGEPLTPLSEGYGGADSVYTGYFHAELETCPSGDTWAPAYEVVFSPAGSADLLPFGGMDSRQFYEFAQAAADEAGARVPLYEESRVPPGTERLLLSDGQMELSVGYDPCPALGGSRMLAKPYDEGAGWRSALTEGGQLGVSLLYVQPVAGLGGVDLAAVCEALCAPGTGVYVCLRDDASPGGDWNMYSGGDFSWRANAEWLAAHRDREVETSY